MQLGQILVKQGFISPQELAQVVQIQPQTSQLLGELLLNRGLISAEQLSQALQEQVWRQQGFWVID
ncbi:MAG TPA: hypothetical protein IGR64_18895 [Leptolyngbyaceae cyanobacterium M65_K2018_010]|nr:hypothetical protein [Leptolyngbyaceae cyanobacterium M65_K2018_010]